MTKHKLSFQKRGLLVSALLALITIASSCEKDLEFKSYGDLSSVINTPEGAVAAVNAAYTGLAGGSDWQGGWTSGTYAWRTQAMMTTDEGVCAWGGNWPIMHNLSYHPDFDWVTHNYGRYMPYISRIAIAIDGIQQVAMSDELKKRYVGELKALRAHYAQLLYFNYGPVTVVTDPLVAADPKAPFVPRPSVAEMVTQIEKDYQEAAAALPDKFTGQDYGRFTKTAALTGLMKLYMHEKDWAKAVSTGEQIKNLGYGLMENYEDNFSIANKGGNSNEVILAIVCAPTAGDQYTNMWLAHSLPPNYADPSGIPLTAWGGYKMRWSSYDKFSSNDKRLKMLLESYPVGKDAGGNILYRNARTGGDMGAVPMKYSPDPSKANSQNSGVDFPVYRYADVLLMLGESINELSGPTSEAYANIDAVRHRAGLTGLADGLSKDEFRQKIQDERLFELWGEGWRKDDLIRWGKFIQRAIDDGSTTAEPHKVLLPLPRSVVTQSNGIIAQNPGYN